MTQIKFEDREEIIKLALKAGLVDKSYRTVRYGLVYSYGGKATVTYKGITYLCIGRSSRGTADRLDADGGIVITVVETAVKTAADEGVTIPEQVR